MTDKKTGGDICVEFIASIISILISSWIIWLLLPHAAAGLGARVELDFFQAFALVFVAETLLKRGK